MKAKYNLLQRIKPALTLGLLLGAITISYAATSPRLHQTFDFDWSFHLGDEPDAAQPEFADQSWRRLDVPHDFSAEGNFSPTNFSCTGFLPGGIAWYRKTFVAPADWKGKLVSVQFDGVSMNSKVWINGQFLGERPYAYSTFAYDLTPYLKFGGTNIIAVRVDHSAVDDSRWYTGSGIYRHVWLMAAEKIHVARHGVYVTAPEVSAKTARVEIQTRVQNQTDADAEVELVTDLLGPNDRRIRSITSKEIIPAKGEKVFTQSAEVASPKLWSPESPMLYTAASKVFIGKHATDNLQTSFGIRSIRFDARQGFFLNGQPMKFKGVCLHHDAGALGAAVPDKVLERRLRLLKATGCNAIRTSHNPPAPEMLDMCDRLGFLVMDEAFDEWTGTKHKWLQGWNAGTPSVAHGYPEFFEQWAEADLSEMILRDRNHPSIVLWSIGNEIDYPNDPFSHSTDGDAYNPKNPSAEILAKIAPRLIKVVRANDPSRPVTAALANIRASNATGLADLLDVVGYNYQLPLLATDLAAFPNRKFVGSEDGFELGYHTLITNNPRLTGQFLWTGFDYLGEARSWPIHGSAAGMFDTCGFEKPRGAQRESLWSDKPMVYACVRSGGGGGRARFGQVESHWNWAGDPRAELPVEVYSNCKSVELFLNGKSLGQKSLADSTDRILRWRVPFQPGELKAVGKLDGKIVSQSLITAGEPARIQLLPDKKKLAADGHDAANVELRLVDAKGVLVPNGSALCSVQVRGAGRLLAVDNGNLGDTTPLSSHERNLNHSRALAIVQSLPNQSGPAEIIVTTPGLPEVRLKLQTN
jgi:beta-galactosidase